ncbi:hypothetical protein [Planctomonas psychrotolerans]|uniref:hypothetical protein n=1 Tax=Planctomonas psychrotolerans TaxID=2528712 RepID=UPI00123AE9B2|nr:hypothetical protein [Planctomonas psychrotolerans]
MTDRTDKNTRYLAIFSDGPLEGTTETRLLENGEYDHRIGAAAHVDNSDALFWYRATGDREVAGEKHVTYAFEPEDSDPVSTNGEVDSLSF